MCIITVLLIGITSPSVRAQTEMNATLKGISTVAVIVEQLHDEAKVLGLTTEMIQTDVELKLLLAGMRVVTQKEIMNFPGSPFVYVNVQLAGNFKAASIDLYLSQNAQLERNGQSATAVVTWFRSAIGTDPTAQDVRNMTKDLADQFLNAWLSVNPKK
jgi:hypothetical protein